APTQNTEQFFDNFASRGIYKDGWMACTLGPSLPWDPANNPARIKAWDAASDQWELYDLSQDFSQANDLAAEFPDKLTELKARFLELADDNKDLPIGGALWTRIHPEDVIATPYTKWKFTGNTRRMPEFTAPGLGKKSNTLVMDLEVGDSASGVLYALGGASAGLTCYMEDGHLCFEYNLFIVERYKFKSEAKIPAGQHQIEVKTTIPRPGAAATIVFTVDGKPMGELTAKRTAPAAFTASETFDVGLDLGSTVSEAYSERRPFKFDGKIKTVNVEMN
ncbi:MAG: arylsulfatase, partial [Planctomycetales bacterium]|nr:arylsulfatase [Planctomycetales bacterium]